MDELPESAKRLLALARAADEPSADARDRVRRGVAIAIGASGAVAAGSAASRVSASTGGAAKLGVASNTSVKVALVFATVASLGAVAWVQRPKPAPAARHAAALPHAAPALPAIRTQEAPQRAEPPAAADQTPEPAAVSSVAPRVRAVAPGAHRSAAGQPGVDQSLRAEMTLLHEASAALDRGDLAQTRALLAAHRERFASGQLRQERRGLEVLARCLARQAGAATAAKAYVDTAPDAVLAARIVDACKLEKTP